MSSILLLFLKCSLKQQLVKVNFILTEQITRSVKGIWYVLLNALVWTNPG